MGASSSTEGTCPFTWGLNVGARLFARVKARAIFKWPGAEVPYPSRPTITSLSLRAARVQNWDLSQPSVTLIISLPMATIAIAIATPPTIAMAWLNEQQFWVRYSASLLATVSARLNPMTAPARARSAPRSGTPETRTTATKTQFFLRRGRCLSESSSRSEPLRPPPYASPFHTRQTTKPKI